MRTSFLSFQSVIAGMVFLMTLSIIQALSWPVAANTSEELNTIFNKPVKHAPFGLQALANLKINFQDAATVPPAGWLRDYGQAYGSRTSTNQGAGNTYGWIRHSDNTPLDLTAYGRKRSTPADILLATLMHMQPNSTTEGKWEALVENGNYDVTVSVGDGAYLNSRHNINIEGVAVIVGFVPTSTTRFRQASAVVNVTDGKLTVDAMGGSNTKINYIIIQPSANSLMVNFQDSATVPPSGWLRDYGQPYGSRTSANQGTGNTYGWINLNNSTPLDITKNGRRRNSPADVLLATLMHMQADDIPNFNGTPVEGRWEAQVANGIYDVTVSIGDDVYYTGSVHRINVEGVTAILDFATSSNVRFRSSTVSVNVSDGRLTVDALGGTNTKINYISIQKTSIQRPAVVAVSPETGSQNVSLYTSISANGLSLPNGGINKATITPSTVFLTEGSNGPVVPANVNGTGGGDAITLVPSDPLKVNTTYVFNVTSGVQDLSGAGFIPFSSTFTTTSVAPPPNGITFTKVQLPNTVGNHSSLTIGPDGKLYALTIDGIIKRFTINADGTLGTPQLIFSLQDAYGPRQPRAAVGFTFDPTSTATNLIAWVTHCSYVFLNAPNWDGKLTRLTGNNLQTVQDVLVNLPRSVKNHLPNSIAFGPDGALYFNQGSNTSMGRSDQTWGNREENLLSAAVLRLDKTKLGATLPLDVKTTDGGGTYNPYATNAPLTIYASGVRNAYDLVWHSNGELYVPTNGSNVGGNTPASVNGTLRPDGTTYNGPVVPALTNVQQVMKDYLFRVRKGGYYGHPNATRGEYALNGGNPTTSIDPGQVNAYPVGIRPDVNWRAYAFDFQTNKSPNGVIEYKSNVFNGALKGKLMVVQYSQNNDIITLTPGGSNQDIISHIEGASIEGFTGFVDPLDLVEDVRNGNIYVSEYGGTGDGGTGDGKITLLQPATTASATQVITKNTRNEDSRVATITGQSVASAYLEQNVPNPCNDHTVIRFQVPANSVSVRVVITDMAGLVRMSIAVNNKGNNYISLNTNTLYPGAYIYTLWVDEKKIDSKRLIVTR